MEITKGFYDLCVPYQTNENDMIAILNELYEGIYRFKNSVFTKKVLHRIDLFVCLHFQLAIEPLPLTKHLIIPSVHESLMTFFQLQLI